MKALISSVKFFIIFLPPLSESSLSALFYGFPYVNLLLTTVPSLRRRLFKPFRPALIPSGLFGTFHDESYYDASEVLPRHHPSALPQRAITLVRPLNGQHIIEGASGLGKTSLLRHLALHSRRPTVFLRAVECPDGVLQAIQLRLQAHIRDEDYLRILVYAGGLDILIDGMNEAPPDPLDITKPARPFVLRALANICIHK